MKNFTYYVGDFETTVYAGQTNTEVWASALVEMFTEDVIIFHSINDTLDFLLKLKKNVCIYYHNLKFDSSFWLSYLMVNLGMQQAYTQVSEDPFIVEWLPDKDMPSMSFKYLISDMGSVYSLTIKHGEYFIEIRDSLKLLPFSVKQIGESFGTKHKKLNIEYTGFRYAGCEITDEEKEYISNDVLVVKEALEFMMNEGHDRLTIGACCLYEFRNNCMFPGDFKTLFPDLSKIEIDYNDFGSNNADEYIRKSYKGGWCYLVKGKSNRQLSNGTTADVNSLYPSMMHSESGNYYPIGSPTFWKGDIPYFLRAPMKDEHFYYFVRIKTRFYIKKNKLPFVQLKNNINYIGNESLETSDIYNKAKNKYYKYIENKDGSIMDTRVTMTLTMTDWQLLNEQYDLKELEILDGCWFYADIGIFDKYIDKYKEIKIKSKGAMRQLAKLFLNNLYGKLATSENSSFKVAYVKPDKTIGFRDVEEYNKQTIYIAAGSAITSYARNFTIRAAQANYYGADKVGFVYADTDSIHCDLPPDKIIGIKTDPTAFCCWKLESCWDIGFFARQKTYIEHVTHEDLEVVDPYYNIKCAGMPDRCKRLFEISMTGNYTDADKLNEEEKEWIKTRRTLDDFTFGLKVPSKLVAKRIVGGILLTSTTYEMRG